MKTAVVFPGQGSQSVGMLADLKENTIIRETFEKASTALGYDIAKLCFEGPLEKLNQTEFTQPALLTASVASFRYWQQKEPQRPEFLAGHSLGEYTALVCAEALSLEDAVRLVEKRGQLMQQAVPEGVGAMAAILGLEDSVLETICNNAQSETGEIVSCANYNSLGQVVIAGTKEGVHRAIEMAKAAGAKRAIPLNVSVPSHCALMKGAAKELAEYLLNVPMKPPRFRIIHNVDVSEHTDEKSIRQALVEQLYKPVRWVETIQKMVQEGTQTILECGPGQVLTGLNKRIVPNIIQCGSVFSGETLCP